MNCETRITALERRVVILAAQIAARDSAITALLKEGTSMQLETARTFYERYPEMLSEIDGRVLESLAEADSTS